MDILIASIIVIIIMIIFIFIMFENIIKRINKNAKKFFVNKLDDYKDIVEEKEKQIEKLNKEIDILKDDKIKLEKTFSENVKYKNEEERTYEEETQVVAKYNLKSPKFREENFFAEYKELKKRFSFDKEKLIKAFIEQHQDKKNERDYKVLSNFKKKFDKDSIYQLMTLPGEDQIKILDSIITEKEKLLINIDGIVKDKSKFNIALLLEKINELLLKLDPIITVYVSKYETDYDYIDPYIRTKHYENMSEGLIIQYKGKSYDFSI